MSVVSIVVDQREPEWVAQADYGVPAQTALLPAGDLMVATADAQMLLIERKTPQDLLSSIADGRLFHQVAAMREQTPWAYLVVTGVLEPDGNGNVTGTNWNYASVQGALLTAQEAGVHVVFCDGRDDFAACVKRLARRDRGAMRLPPVRGISIFGEGEMILSSLPGIGPEKALQLIKHFPNAAWAVQYLTDTAWDDKGVTGIANGTKTRVRNAMGLDEEHMLAVIPISLNGENESDQ